MPHVALARANRTRVHRTRHQKTDEYCLKYRRCTKTVTSDLRCHTALLVLHSVRGNHDVSCDIALMGNQNITPDMSLM